MTRIEARDGATSAIWAGRVLTGLAALALLADGATELLAPALLRQEMIATGFAPEAAATLGVLTILCAVVYVVPRTAILGAILITGFLGGAICTHFRLGEIGSPPQIACLVLGVMAWGGIYLRDPRLQALLPLTA